MGDLGGSGFAFLGGGGEFPVGGLEDRQAEADFGDCC
jgi:hypothetical protein